MKRKVRVCESASILVDRGEKREFIHVYVEKKDQAKLENQGYDDRRKNTDFGKGDVFSYRFVTSEIHIPVRNLPEPFLRRVAASYDPEGDEPYSRIPLCIVPVPSPIIDDNNSIIHPTGTQKSLLGGNDDLIRFSLYWGV
jgi:hypothetical protein